LRLPERGFLVSAGRRLATITHFPEAARTATPAVVLGHGLANDYDEAGQFAPLAERLADAGFVVLRFDFRGGRRDTMPGCQFPAGEWPHDLRAAISSVRSLDAVRVVVIGASAGGSVALSVGCLEPELKGIASLGSPADGARWFEGLWTRVHGRGGWRSFLSELDDDRRQRTTGAPSRRVRLAGEFLPVRADQLEETERFVREHPGMLDELPLAVADDLLLLRPETVADRIAVPVLVLHGAEDTLVLPEEAERLATGDQSRAVVVDEQPHQMLLGPRSEEVTDLLVEWSCSVAAARR
jgi:pimeloyl-ACP methyl ester carboxylesterase